MYHAQDEVLLEVLLELLFYAVCGYRPIIIIFLFIFTLTFR